MNTYLDHYCERISPALWDEPFNALSNLAFILSAILLIKILARSSNKPPRTYWDIWCLTIIIIFIGLGSGLWHLLATHWALWADRIPILLFINIYMLSCLVRVLKLSAIPVVSVFVFYHIVNTLTHVYLLAMTLNGSIFYIPTAIFLLGICIAILNVHPTAAKRYFIPATLVFFISLTFRTIDNEACNIVPIGTHFLWHILNSVTIYILMLGLMKQSGINTDNENKE